MIACPERSVLVTAFVAATMKDTSGSLYFDSGVGTQMEIASGSDSRDGSVVASNLSLIPARSASETSLMCDLPALSPSTTRWLMS